jgi:hypothetical protein
MVGSLVVAGGIVLLGLSFLLDDWMNQALGTWTPPNHPWRVAIVPSLASALSLPPNSSCSPTLKLRQR